MRTFNQLTSRDRVKISRLRSSGLSISDIARKIGKDKSTISRELKRNAQQSSVDDQLFWFAIRKGLPPEPVIKAYKDLKKNFLAPTFHWDATNAQKIRDHRLKLANQVRRRKNRKTHKWVIEKLKLGWTPEQISGRSRYEAVEHISHEFVYQIVIKDRLAGGTLFHHLPRFRKRKSRLSRRKYDGWIPHRIGIENRPKCVERRERIGDTEADLIQGYRQSGFILTVVDRSSRYVVLRKLENKNSNTVLKELIKAIKLVGPCWTLTMDNGREFARHHEVRKACGVQTFFCRPYYSNERGTVENTNGLVRRYLPKGTCFKNLTQAKLNKIQNSLNQRPRECLFFLTPNEVHFNVSDKRKQRCI